MKTFKYTSQIVNNLNTFSKYVTLIDFITDKNPYWRNRLKSVVLNESSLSAVLADTKITRTWMLNPTESKVKELITEEQFKAFQSYLETSKFIAKGAYTTEKFNTLNFWKSLHEHALGLPDHTTKLRKTYRVLFKDVFINNIHQQIETRVKTSPQKIEKEINNLFDLENTREDIIPGILAGLYHLNIALIHPFDDGNGRIAKLMDRIILKKYGIPSELLITEDYFLINQEKYFELIESCADDCTLWLEFYTSALVFSVLHSIEILRMLTAGSIDIIANTIIETTPRECDVIELLNQYDQLSASELSRMLKMSRQAAGQLVHSLENKKIVNRIGANTSVRFKLNASPSTELFIIK